jgi:hypothetical protein
MLSWPLRASLAAACFLGAAGCGDDEQSVWENGSRLEAEYWDIDGDEVFRNWVDTEVGEVCSPGVGRDGDAIRCGGVRMSVENERHGEAVDVRWLVGDDGSRYRTGASATLDGQPVSARLESLWNPSWEKLQESVFSWTSVSAAPVILEEGLFADAGCTQAVVGLDELEPGELGHPRRGSVTVDGETSVYRLGDEVEVAYELSGGNCVGATAPPEWRLFELLGVIEDPPADFAVVGDGRIKQIWQASADGRQVAPFWGNGTGGGSNHLLLDSGIDEVCVVRVAADGAYRCLPVGREGGFCYADSACSEVAYCPYNDGGEGSSFAYPNDSESGDVAYELGSELDQAFHISGVTEECEELDLRAFEVEVVPSGRFVEAELVKP